jgi:hypothetical protein
MKKTFQLHVEGKHPDRLLDAIKHEIRKYLKRERRRDLPEGVDFWDFDCKFGLAQDTAEVVHLANVMACIDNAVANQATQFYVEVEYSTFRPNSMAVDGLYPCMLASKTVLMH